MNSIKKVVKGLLIAGLLGVGIGKLEAASTDTIILLVTPVGTLSVSISSPTADVGYDFTTVDLNSVSQSGLAATVTNTGNISAQWMLKAAALDTWQIGNSTGSNQAVLQALFGQPGGQYPTIGDFDSVNSSLTVSNVSSKGDVVYSTGGIMGASIPANGAKSRSLWFKIKTPSDSSVSDQQRFRVYAVAGQP